MKSHTSGYKEQIKKMGRQQSVQIIYTINGIQTILGVNDINAVTYNYEASLLKSVMKQLEIDSNMKIPKNTSVRLKYGIKVNNSYEYLDFGNFIVYEEPEYNADTHSYNIKCYDRMIYSMKDYEELNVNYPITLKDYLLALCSKLGYTLGTSTFANMNQQLQADVFKDIGFTYRDVLDDIAEATGSTIYFNSNGNLILGQISDTNDTIDEEFMKDVNVTFGEKYRSD